MADTPADAVSELVRLAMERDELLATEATLLIDLGLRIQLDFAERATTRLLEEPDRSDDDPALRQLFSDTLMRSIRSALTLAEGLRAALPPDTIPAQSSLLLVDDDPDIILVWELGLTSEGWRGERRVAVDGQAALDAVAGGYQPDAILTGLLMPHLNGFEAIPRLRDDLGYQGAIVVCSSMGTASGTTEALGHLVDAQLDKPMAMEELSVRLRNAIARRQRLTGG